MDIIELYGQRPQLAKLINCILVEEVSDKCHHTNLEFSHLTGPVKPTFKYPVNTPLVTICDAGGRFAKQALNVYMVHIRGRWLKTVDASVVKFFAQTDSSGSGDGCGSQVLQSRSLAPPVADSERNFCLQFTFQAKSAHSYLGLCFLEGQCQNLLEISKFLVEAIDPCQVPVGDQVTLISQHSLPLTIKKPGKYQVIEDLEFESKCAIKILSSHVVLDLQQHNIKYLPDPVECCVFDDPQVDSTPLAISVGAEMSAETEGLPVCQCLPAGKLKNIIIKNGSLIGAGLVLRNVCFFELKTLKVCQVTSRRALLFNQCQYGTIKDCQALDNQEFGFVIVGTENAVSRELIFEDCRAVRHRVGFLTSENVSDQSHLIFNNCQSLENLPTETESAVGFSLAGNNHQVTGCLVDNYPAVLDVGINVFGFILQRGRFLLLQDSCFKHAEFGVLLNSSQVLKETFNCNILSNRVLNALTTGFYDSTVFFGMSAGTFVNNYADASYLIANTVLPLNNVPAATYWQNTITL